ncbi:hypothetical protein D3C84_770690 [compost metagenome]
MHPHVLVDALELFDHRLGELVDQGGQRQHHDLVAHADVVQGRADHGDRLAGAGLVEQAVPLVMHAQTQAFDLRLERGVLELHERGERRVTVDAGTLEVFS